MVQEKHFHFIGGGQMAEAIIRAVVHKHVIAPELISVSDLDPARERYLADEYGITVASSPEQGLAHSSVIVLAVRPQDDLNSLGRSIEHYAAPNTILLSIVAGVTIAQLEAKTGKRPVVRVIPNTLTDTDYGYNGVALNTFATLNSVAAFLNGFGKIMQLDESLIDIFTGYGVAGPNYVYYFIESLADAGVLAGLPRAQAWEVALENVAGAAAMLRQSGLHPRQLLDINNSPGGVGINALHELNASDFAAGLQRSVRTAVRRTTELGKGESKNE